MFSCNLFWFFGKELTIEGLYVYENDIFVGFNQMFDISFNSIINLPFSKIYAHNVNISENYLEFYGR